MSKVVLGPAHPGQAQQERANAKRLRKGSPSTGPKISMSRSGAAADTVECRGCRHWRPFVTQWGHCGCEMVRRHVDGEAPLVTRGSFSCRFYAPGAEARRSNAPVSAEDSVAHVFAAAD
jgi:hypothetical protein